MLTADDITEQKLAEKEALEVSAKNEAILNLLPDLIFECKRDGIIVDYRTSIEDDLYVLPNEFLGKKIIEILPKELAWKTMHSIEQTIQTKELQSFQYQLPMNGKMVDFEARLVACGEDSALVIVSDITERKRIEKDLRESEEKFKTIFENANDAIYLTDLNGQFLEVNQMACDQLGYSRSELIQMSPHDIDSSDDPAQVKNRINQLLQDGHILFESAHVRKDGSTFPVESNFRLINYMGEKGFLGISRDITNHKQAEKMIREKAEAEAANISKSKFLTNMSHELRTPLNSIIGFSQMLNSNPFGNLNEKETKYSYNIITSGKHLLDLINDILDISKIESGEMELEFEKFSLSFFICDMVNIIKHLADEKNIEICNQFRSESIEMHADRLRMKQILYNLLSNSLKFTPENGCI
ncbi:PAS domain S-box protein [Methanococcoides sp. SA1]|nr:PAS domain S-box protein [Methanococcoides sp. SA1]